MGRDKFQGQGGRILGPLYPKQSCRIFNPTQSHGHMASSFRGRKNLVCFYCNKKSGIKYDGIITEWHCAQCESTNFLDENGDITDPPVATDYAAPNNLKYAIPLPDSPPSSRVTDSDLFCSTCLKNQHLFTASLAQYDVELDPKHPHFRERERQYFTYRKNLEKRYPQVCEDCEPKVLERMREAGKTAKTDYLRRLMDKTRAKKYQKPKHFSMSRSFEFTGKLLWYAGLLGQFIWSIMTFAAYTLHSSPTTLDLVPSSAMAFLKPITAISTSSSWARTSLYCSISSFWWNPMFNQMNKGFMNHINGFGDWYKFQVIMIISRSIFYYISGTGILADPFAQPSIGAHLFVFAFITILTIKAHHSLKVDMTPLWASTPEKLVNVGPRSRSPDQATDNMADILDSIAATPSRRPRELLTPSPPLQNTHNGQLGHTYDTPLRIPKHRSPLPIPGRASPSLLDMTHNESSRYLITGEVPARLEQQNQNQNNDGEAMDWTPAHPQSEHRAFNPSRSIQRNTQLFGQAPIVDQPSPFWYKVPPAPTTPAQRLRNPPNQPRLRVSSQEVKENFFNNVARRNSDSDQGENGFGQRNERTRHVIEFTQQKFFPQPPPSEAGNNLADLLTSFSLGSSDPETPKAIEKRSRLRHGCQAIFLSLGLFFWNHTFLNPTEHSKSVMLTVMIGCMLIGARTILDHTIFSLPNKKGVSQGMGAIFGGLQCGLALYRISEILAGRGDCVNCASLGTILLGGMFVQELWCASFGK